MKAKIKEVVLVHIINGKPFTDSLIVAGEFSMQHKNVLAKIKEALESEDDEIREFSRLNFKPRDYKKRGKLEPKYESKFCNRALTGKWEAIPDDAVLDAYDARLLKAIRLKNTALIIQYPGQKPERKAAMEKFVEEYRIKHPRLKLVQ